MTLHDTINLAKKVLLWVFIAIGGVFLLFVLFQFGLIVKNMLFPPQIQPPTSAYGKLPTIRFPENAVTQKFTYTLNTISGVLPEFPNRLDVFPITEPKPNFLNLEKAKEKVARLGFVTDQGELLPERSLGNNTYLWSKNEGINKKITFNIITFNFILESDYLTSLSILESRNIPDEKDAMNSVKYFLESAGLFSEDLAIEKTTTPVTDTTYITNPQLFAIQNSILIPTTSLATTQVLRIDLYQKDIDYTLHTGIPDLSGGYQQEKVTFPIVYPRPPYSTMSFWTASPNNNTEVVSARFTHQSYSKPTDIIATYPIKTAEEALEELKNGKGYIATYGGTGNNAQITKVYLAYYLGEVSQQYIMPVIVFEGDNNLFAYVSAVRNEWITE